MKRALVLAVLAGPAALAAEAKDGGFDPRLIDVPVAQAESLMAETGRGLRASLSADWLRPSVLGLERWQWVALPILLFAVALLTLLLVRGSRALALRFARTRPSVSTVLDRLDAPLRLWWASLLARVAIPLLTLSAATEAAWERVFRVGFGLAFFWGALRAVGAWSEHFGTSTYAQQHPGSRSLVSLFTRIARFALVAFAILATLSEFGYSVTSVLAGLGIGGIALALGAQKTLENVFGAFALAVDQPIREGDLVRVGDLTGTVESIGLRSTRIRTAERTVVTIPNGKLADLHLETFATRDRIRFVQVLSLSLATRGDQLAKVLEDSRKLLLAHERLWPDSGAVSLVAFAPGSIDVEIAAAFATTDFAEFRGLREKLLLELLRVLEQAKVELAQPVLRR